MLRRSIITSQFKMGKYKGPLPSSSNSNKQKLQSPFKAAETIANQIREQNLKEEHERMKNIETRQFMKHRSRQHHHQSREENERYMEEFKRHLEEEKNNKMMKQQQKGKSGTMTSAARLSEAKIIQDDDDLSIFENDNDNEHQQDYHDSTLVSSGVHNKSTSSPSRAALPPTLGPRVEADAWVSKPSILDANRRLTTLMRDRRKKKNNNSMNSKHDENKQPSSSSKTMMQQDQDDDFFENNNANDEIVNTHQNNNKNEDDTLSFQQIDKILLCPALAQAFAQRRVSSWQLTKPTSFQSLALEISLGEKRDLCCIAPTGTGKTLCFVLPAIQAALDANGLADASVTFAQAQAKLQERDMIQAADAQKKLDEVAHVCQYCGLNMREQKVCPHTGAPHPPVSPHMESKQMSVPPNENNNSADGLEEDEVDYDEDGNVIQLSEEEKQRRRESKENLRRETRAHQKTGTPTSLIIAPSGVLVDQIHSVLRSLHCGLKIGYLRGTNDDLLRYEMLRSMRGCDILVATTGYCLMMMNKGLLNMKNVRFFAIDEIDLAIQLPEFDLLSLLLSRLPGGKMSKRDSRHLDPITGQLTSIRHYASQTDAVFRPQKMFVGASLPSKMFPLISKMMDPNTARWILGNVLDQDANRLSGMTNYIPAAANANNSNNDKTAIERDIFGGMTVASSISHTIILLSHLEKTDKIRALYDTGRLQSNQQVIIFCNTRANVEFLKEQLPETLYHHDVKMACVLPKQREETKASTLRRFQTGNIKLLITTDMLARGVDFHNVHAVIQYDFPHHFDTYLHRAGRTGRRGEPGLNIAFFEPQDARLSKPLVSFLQKRRQDVPPKLLQYSRQSWSDLYREQVHGISMRAFSVKNGEVRKSPLGLGVRRYPNVAGDIEIKNNKNRHFLPVDLKEDH